MKIDTSRVFFFSKICQENSSFIKTDKNKEYFTWRGMGIYDNISLNSSQIEKGFKTVKKIKRKIKTRILYSINSFPKIVPFMTCVGKCGTPRQATDRNTVGCMRNTGWITKAAGTHPEYVILLLFLCDNCYTNAPRYYSTRALLVLM